jgi:hypothetical protein
MPIYIEDDFMALEIDGEECNVRCPDVTTRAAAAVRRPVRHARCTKLAVSAPCPQHRLLEPAPEFFDRRL